MKILLLKTLLIFTLLCGYLVFAPSVQIVTRNAVLIKQIDSMFQDDQFWRIEFTKRERKEKSIYSDETIQKSLTKTDSVNKLKAKIIVKEYGYPGYDLVGSSSDRFWVLVQHCDNDVPFQQRVLALMKQQIAKNNASKKNYTLLANRVLVNVHQQQVYGTQASIDPKTNKEIPFPLEILNWLLNFARGETLSHLSST
ncbi:DUF6624 domain-containing protein [Mucilaginibacter lappiensis]|uniref:ABC-type transport system substrate-binding protein n=1 Tax=Mucilaginibacter lappiensis TaxID=354630 RepID=A0A841JM74_9SPHI|nr:DUF6624 domain-containing protein [Mucilaginibacter lappiensis]MBB6131372.1 ABC-type transport system substrate-binding protein [Mucilaginibacter lappiensis]